MKITTHPDLSLHGDTKECNKVHNENGPKDGDVEAVEECTNRRYEGRLRDTVPELELWESTDKRTELFIRSRWELRPTFISFR